MGNNREATKIQIEGIQDKETEKYSSYSASKHSQTNSSKFRRFKDPEKESNAVKPKKNNELYERNKQVCGNLCHYWKRKSAYQRNNVWLRYFGASISEFHKEWREFVKYENQALVMQISAENIEEVELNHIRDLKVKTELKKLIENYKPEKTATTDVAMRIILKDDKPLFQSPRRLAITEREEVNKQIEEWLKEGIIRSGSSEYASPIVLVKKKDGTSRMFIDYRKLNQKLVTNKFPLPLIEDVLDTLQEAKVYSTLDSRKRFFHVSVDEDCKKIRLLLFQMNNLSFTKFPLDLVQVLVFFNDM
ncbi:Retrovirus-related Pol polyprotein from transposon 412 [Araneus ventricosus]|uniref:Retrovirus-related Pol polyprotein from transposon 412 n=1 Tax=Araneus ventricosus TaxID=182803 RepID=A0A4Y2AJC9_ARAVE|nr:Retrovirus-related Pol polyprotein from transposon 412 [Araneus ventricosus]